MGRFEFAPALISSRYTSDFVRNSLVILTILFTLLTVVGVLLMLDKICKRYGNRRLSSCVINISLRFLYMVFFDLILCCMIHFASKVFSREMSRTNLSALVWFVALAILCTLVAMVCFVFSRLFINGPYVAKSYSAGSLLTGLWWSTPRRLSDQI